MNHDLRAAKEVAYRKGQTAALIFLVLGPLALLYLTPYFWQHNLIAGFLLVVVPMVAFLWLPNRVGRLFADRVK